LQSPNPETRIYPFLPPVFGGLLARPRPDGFPVVLGAFFNPLDFDITIKLKFVIERLTVTDN
jgi:hypothetical protein